MKVFLFIFFTLALFGMQDDLLLFDANLVNLILGVNLFFQMVDCLKIIIFCLTEEKVQ
jgi:hypothetical protein